MRSVKEKLHHLNGAQFNRFAPWLLAALLTYLSWKLASIFWLWVAPPMPMQLERVELGSQQPQVPSISAFSLFQENNVSSGATLANFVLQGVVVSYPSQYSSAVIKVNEVADRYRVGETLAGTAYQLAEVYWDHVVLRDPTGQSQQVAFNRIANGLNQPIVPPAAAAASLPTANSPQSTQNALGQAVQQMQQNRDQFLADMGVGAATSEGYEVTSKTPSALRNTLGLQPGDRILSLNGQGVGQGQNDAQLLEQAKQAGQVKLEIKRGDQVMTIQQNF
ncbi:general secretion pathway protein [Acinetobacter sp. ANC 4910]|uniref:type II secretion system protein N n=1 Tax=Acinetobacter sp. ANC 4910 TaxID=2529850 RepID=UPI00103B6282|nr:type II secretion system protein N [Acinetobacter sp. ANC 4910]TCB33592.1 general secretion pathway protein [Acinetobacter sp. ANC 4910]